jgi:hypothetical protein
MAHSGGLVNNDHNSALDNNIDIGVPVFAHQNNLLGLNVHKATEHAFNLNNQSPQKLINL